VSAPATERTAARTPARRRRTEPGDDHGSAVVEFVFVAVVLLAPLMYFIAAVADVQRNSLAVAQAARAAGRAFATSDSAARAGLRADAAVRLALTDQGIADDAQVRFVAADADCDAAAVPPVLRAGGEFAVCVIRRVRVPAVPSVLAGRGIRTVGRYVVHVDDFRTVQP
jgi:Flp pilus assembly protein TadG